MAMVHIAGERWSRRLMARAFDFIGKLQRSDPVLPPLSMRRFVGEGNWDLSGNSFRSNGLHFAEKLVADAGLTPHSSILDLGSGCGRLAIPLMRILEPPGTYTGLELSAPLIDWCTRHITAQRPNFRFVHCDLMSPLYNPTGTGEPSSYVLPFEAEAFDIVVATSVFTHLLPPAPNNYLRECSRVLAPGGRLFTTFYLYDGQSGSMQRSVRFDHEYDSDARITDVKHPEAAVAYRTAWLLQTASNAGLELAPPIRWGAWAGRPFTYSGQDVILFTKR